MTGGISALGKAGKLAKGAGLVSKGDDLVRIAAKKAAKFKEAADLGKLNKVATTALDKKNSKLWVGVGEEIAGGAHGMGPRQARNLLSPRDLITYSDDPLAASGLFDEAMDAYAIKKKMGSGWRPSWFNKQMDKKLGQHLQFMGLNVPGLGGRLTGAKKLDQLGQSLRWSKGGRQLAKYMDASVRGASTKEFQRAAQQLTGQQELSRLNARRFVAEQATTASRMSKSAQDPDALRSFFETANAGKSFSPTDVKTLEGLKDTFGQQFESSLRRAQELGVPIQTLTDPAGIAYFPRFAVGGTPLASRPGMLFDPFDASSLHRADHLKGIPGGTEQIRTIITDPKVNDIVDRIRSLKKFPHLKSGKEALEIKTLKKDLDQLINSNYGTQLANPDLNSARAMASITGGIPHSSPTVHVRKMRDWLINLEPEARRMGVFANHPFQDAATRLTRAEDSIAAAELVTGKMIKHAEHATRGGASMSDGVSLRKVMEDMHLDTTIEAGAAPKHLRNMFDDLNAAGKGVGGDAASVLDEFFVPRSVHEELVRVNDFYKVPGVVGDLKKAMDGFLTLTKAHLTTPFAAFAGRNFLSGQFRNFAIGLHGFGSMKQAHDLLVGKTVRGSAKIPMVKQMLRTSGRSATDKNATDLLREMVYKHDLVPASSYGVDPVTSRALGGATPSVGLPGYAPMKTPFRGGLVGKWFGFGKDVTRNPFDVAGGIKPRFGKGLRGKIPKAEEVFQTRFGPVAAGVELNAWVEGMNRLSPMIEGLKRGHSDNAIASAVKRAQVDYSSRKFTSFEREILQRIFPFYKFRMGQMKYLPGHLMEKPGGAIHQVMRGSQLARGEGYMPDYISQTAAARVPEGTPISPDDPETARYLTGFGLMFEDPLSMAFNPLDQRGWKSAGLELASAMRPELKMPAEFLTGQSFFQRGPSGGRPLRELGSPFQQIASNLSGIPLEDRPFRRGGPGVLEQLAMNSPLSRYITTARQLSSPVPRALQGKYSDAAKSAFNVLTGLRLSDVTLAGQRKEQRMRTEEAIRSLPSATGRDYLQTYVPKRDVVGLAEGGDLRQAAQAEALNAILRRLRVESRERAAEKQERRLGGKVEVDRRQEEIDAIIEMLRKQLPATSLY